jgi:hypothetical protein
MDSVQVAAVATRELQPLAQDRQRPYWLRMSYWQHPSAGLIVAVSARDAAGGYLDRCNRVWLDASTGAVVAPDTGCTFAPSMNPCGVVPGAFFD